MPDENPILIYWRTEQLVFNKNLLSLREHMNEDATHDLRVAIKKLRSCFKVYAGLTKKRDKHQLPADIDSLFSVLGKHRDIEMSKKLLLTLGGKNTAFLDPIVVYLQLLQDQAGEYSKSYIQRFESKELESVTTQVETGLGNLNNEQILSETAALINSCLQEVEEDLKDFKKRAHLIRKKLKEVFYQSKMLHAQSPFSKSQLQDLDTILDNLGNVHDYDVLILNLKNFRKTILSKAMKEYAMIKRVEERAEKKKNALLEKAAASAEELLAHYKAVDLKNPVSE